MGRASRRSVLTIDPYRLLTSLFRFFRVPKTQKKERCFLQHGEFLR